MNRTIGIRIIIFLVLLFFSFIIYSTITSKDPLEKEFYGIVSYIRRMYPSKVVFEFENQTDKFYMSNDLKEFRSYVNIGDSIAKQLNNNYIFIYKFKNNKIIESRKFVYK